MDINCCAQYAFGDPLVKKHSVLLIPRVLLAQQDFSIPRAEGSLRHYPFGLRAKPALGLSVSVVILTTDGIGLRGRKPLGGYPLPATSRYILWYALSRRCQPPGGRGLPEGFVRVRPVLPGRGRLRTIPGAPALAERHGPNSGPCAVPRQGEVPLMSIPDHLLWSVARRGYPLTTKFSPHRSRLPHLASYLERTR